MPITIVLIAAGAILLALFVLKAWPLLMKHPGAVYASLAGAAFLLLVFALLMPLGKRAGEHDARVTIQRLEILWPDLMEMPVADRAVLVGLSMTCRLEAAPDTAFTRDQVMACLTRGLMAEDPHLPKGVSKSDAAKTFARLSERAR